MTNRLEHSKSTWPIFGIFLTLTAFGVSTNAIPPLITTIADRLGVSYANFGCIIMFQFTSFFVAGIVGGWICERYNVNSRTFVLAGLLLVGLTFLVGSTLTRLTWFAVWTIPLGFGGGLTETFGSVLISRHDKPNSSKLLNLSQVFFCIGAICAPLVVALMLYIGMPWRHIFVLFGLFMLLVLCIFACLTGKQSQVVANPVHIAKNSSAPLLKDSLFVLLAATILIYVTFESLVTCWISVYFEMQLSCPIPYSALRLSIFWIGVIAGRLAITLLPRRVSLWPAMFAGVSMMCLGAVLASLTHSPTWATVFVFLNGLGAGPVWPATVAIGHSARNRPRFTSSLIGVGAFGVVLGSGLGALIFRYLDYSLFFPSIALGCIILLGLGIFSYRENSKTHNAG